MKSRFMSKNVGRTALEANAAAILSPFSVVVVLFFLWGLHASPSCKYFFYLNWRHSIFLHSNSRICTYSLPRQPCSNFVFKRSNRLTPNGPIQILRFWPVTSSRPRRSRTHGEAFRAPPASRNQRWCVVTAPQQTQGRCTGSCRLLASSRRRQKQNAPICVPTFKHTRYCKGSFLIFIRSIVMISTLNNVNKGPCCLHRVWNNSHMVIMLLWNVSVIATKP